jgi:hypothetical protein
MKPNGSKPDSAFRYWAELGDVQPVDKLVRGLFGEKSFGLIEGASGSGKSFLALDKALHLTLGWPWFGRKLMRVPVAYVAAEGQAGANNRIAAFRQRHGVDVDANVPFALLPMPIDLRSPDGATDWLIQQLKLAEEKMAAGPIGVTVIDTLARSFGGGDENHPGDMGSFIANMDKIRTQVGCAVDVVHHQGKDEKRGSRGHNSLPAAADTILRVEGLEGTRTVTIVKQKDGETGGTFTFRLEVETVGRDDDGTPITSCIVVPTDVASRRAPKKPQKLTDRQRIAKQAIENLFAAGHGEPAPTSNHIPSDAKVSLRHSVLEALEVATVAKEISDQRRRREAIGRILESLQSRGVIGAYGDWVWLAQTTDASGAR